ncbi:MAG: hypothetical protein JNK80_09220, partial [Dechloromonas sp.]|nr:hypothetical protein [Dechloromonas sp.]
PESKPALDLFHTFRQRKLSFALCVDEYGGVTGLVTMEDLLECVFGEITSPSETDAVNQHLIGELPDGRRLIDTGVALADFNREFAVSLVGEDVETLAGALLDAFGELPANGAAIELCGLGFTVDGVEHNRITRVIVERLPEAVASPDGAVAAETVNAAAAEDVTAGAPASKEGI